LSKYFQNLNNAFKNIKSIWIDRTCNYCKEEINKIESNKLKYGEIIIIKPDYNGSGYITHYHILTIKPNNGEKFKRVIESIKRENKNALEERRERYLNE